MQVKAADIARAMGISKATVSLALNGKGGVSEQTRQEVFLCREALERGEEWKGGASPQKGGGVRPSGEEVKLVRLHRGRRGEPEFGQDLNEILEKEFRELGYSLGVTYFDLRSDGPELLREQCALEKVAGVLVLAGELFPREAPLLGEIQKPLLVYDADLGEGRYCCVLADERGGVELGVERLFKAGAKRLLYLGGLGEGFKSQVRKRGYLESMARRGVEDPPLGRVGLTADQAYLEMKRRLREETLPEGILFESAFVALGCMRALLEAGIRFPEQVSLLSLEPLPSYLTGGRQLESLLFPRSEQAYWAAQLLARQMQGRGQAAGRLYLSCSLQRGETVR